MGRVRGSLHPVSWLRVVHRRLIVPLFATHGSTHSLALGVSLGIFVGMTPTVGIQMVVAFLMAAAVRANRIVAVAWVWISNPLTFIPMYYGYYSLGVRLLGARVVGYEAFKSKMSDFDIGFLEGIQGLLSLGEEIAEPLCLGSLVVASVLAVLTYPVTYYLIQSWRGRKTSRERSKAGVKGERVEA